MTIGLVLGAAVWPNGPSPTLRRRTLHAAKVFHTFQVSDLVVCGGLGGFPPTEAAMMRDLLTGAGVPPARIRVEDRSTNTRENIRFALPLLAELGTRDVLIVTDWYHAPRARLIARRMGLCATSSSPPLAGASLKQQIKSVLREVPAFILAWVRF